MANPVIGVYDGIEVQSSSVFVSGRTVPIIWVNMYTFYFKWDEGNHQIWTFDSSKNGLYQICNNVLRNALQHIRNKHSCANIPTTQKHLGQFKDMTVNESNVFHYGETKDISWINPLAFYLKWTDGNEQVWIYDASVTGYLQLGQWANSVKDVYNRNDYRTYRNVAPDKKGIYNQVCENTVERAEEEAIKSALAAVGTNVGARHLVKESCIGDANKEIQIMEFVTKSMRSHKAIWPCVNQIANEVENAYGGIWGVFIGVNPCSLSMMGGRDHLTLVYGNVTVFVFKRN